MYSKERNGSFFRISWIIYKWLEDPDASHHVDFYISKWSTNI